MARVDGASYGGSDFYDPDFNAGVSVKMQVPKRLKVNGVSSDDEHEAPFPTLPSYDKFEMRVPERILVVGQDQHVGTDAPPLELEVENTIMPPDPGLVRVLTPPHVITLDQHYFPTAADDYYQGRETGKGTFELDEESSIANNVRNSRNIKRDNTPNTNYLRKNSIGNRTDILLDSTSDIITDNTLVEVVHLRKQLTKLNRRIIDIEREMITYQQRDRLLLSVVSAYFVIKFFMWLRSP